MELLGLMIGLGIVAILLVIPVILLVRVAGLCRGMRELQQQLIRLEGRLGESVKPDAPVAVAPESAPVAAASVSDAGPEPAPPPVPQQPYVEPAFAADSVPSSAPRGPNAVERALA